MSGTDVWADRVGPQHDSSTGPQTKIPISLRTGIWPTRYAAYFVCDSLILCLLALWLFIGLLAYTSVINTLLGERDWSYSIGWIGFVVSLVSAIYYSLVAIYRLRHPDDGRSTAQQIYAPLSQWDNASSSDSDDNNL